jgi:hypothetical protein
MQCIGFVCLVSAAFILARSAPADDKKPAARSFAEDAQLLGGKSWISEEEFNLPGAKKGDPKYKFTISFESDKGKASGKADLGMYAEVKVGEFTGGGGVSVGGYTFELIEEGAGYRAIKLFLPDAKVNGKPMMEAPRLLYYSLDADKLTVRPADLPGWTVESPKTHFKRKDK